MHFYFPLDEKKEQLKNMEKDVSSNVIKAKEIFENSRENQENYKFLYNELNSFREKLDNIKFDYQSKNEVSNILKESILKINEMFPKINSEEIYVKSNFDLPMQYNTNKDFFNTKNNNKNFIFNKNNNNINNNYDGIFNQNKSNIQQKYNNKHLQNFDYVSKYNNNNDPNSLYNNNHNLNYNIPKNLDIFKDKNFITKEYNNNKNSPIMQKIFGNFNNNNLDIACLESNLFSDMSCSNSKINELKRMDFPKQNLAFLNENNINKYDLSKNIQKTFSSSDKFIKTSPQKDLKNNIKNKVNNNYNSKDLGFKEITDLSKYESLQYDYSASIDLNKIQSKDFQNLPQINEDRNENYYNDSKNHINNEYRTNDTLHNVNNNNVKEDYSHNRKMENVKFNKKLMNNFSSLNSGSNNCGQFYNNNNNNNSYV